MLRRDFFKRVAGVALGAIGLSKVQPVQGSSVLAEVSTARAGRFPVEIKFAGKRQVVIHRSVMHVETREYTFGA